MLHEAYYPSAVQMLPPPPFEQMVSGDAGQLTSWTALTELTLLQLRGNGLGGQFAAVPAWPNLVVSAGRGLETLGRWH